MYIFSLVSYGFGGVVVWGGNKLIQIWGQGEWAKKCLPPLFSPGFPLVSPQSHPFTSSLTGCDGVVYRPKKFNRVGLVQHQPSAKYYQAEGLAPE